MRSVSLFTPFSNILVYVGKSRTVLNPRVTDGEIVMHGSKKKNARRQRRLGVGVQATRPENIAVDEACMQALVAQANRLSVSRVEEGGKNSHLQGIISLDYVDRTAGSRDSLERQPACCRGKA